MTYSEELKTWAESRGVALPEWTFVDEFTGKTVLRAFDECGAMFIFFDDFTYTSLKAFVDSLEDEGVCVERQDFYFDGLIAEELGILSEEQVDDYSSYQESNEDARIRRYHEVCLEDVESRIETLNREMAQLLDAKATYEKRLGREV